MISINPAITLLHEAYNKAMGNLNLPMTVVYERMYFEAIQMGLTPEMMEICVRERVKLNLTSQFKMKLGLYNLIGTEDDTARIMNEAAVVLASRRKRIMEPAKASVLRQSGRSDQVQSSDAKLVGELLENLKKSAS